MAIPLLRFFFRTAKKGTKPPFTVLCPVELPERFPPLWEVAPSVVGRCRPAFSECRPKPVLLPGSFCVPLRHRLSDLSRFHRPINIKLWQRKLIPRCRQDLDLLTKWRADPFCGKINSTKLNLSCTEQIMLAENLYHFSKQKLCKKFVRLSSICL